MKIIAIFSSSFDDFDSAIVQVLIRSFLEPIAVTEYPMLKLIKMTEVMLVSVSLLAIMWSMMDNTEIITICGIVFGESRVFRSLHSDVSVFLRDSNSELKSL